MALFSSISLPLILVALAGFVTLLLLIMAAVGMRSRHVSDPNDDPRCGACGCIIARPKEKICPTCGTVLAAVGLVLPFSKRRTESYTGRQAFFRVSAFPLALWTACIAGLAVGGTLAIDQWLLPYVWQSTSTLQARPRSGGCQAIVISTLEQYSARGKAKMDTPGAIRTALLEVKTESGSHALSIDLLGPSFSYTDAAGKRVAGSALPGKNNVMAFMRASGVPLSPASSQEAGIIAAMISNMTARESMVIAAPNQRAGSAPSLDTTRITFNGGQWKEAIPLRPLAMSISSGLWLLGFSFIIWKQRGRRAALAAALLAPPVVVPANQDGAGDDDGIGGWDITLGAEDPFGNGRPPTQLPLKPAALKQISK